jgi:hypothetical protein
MGLRTGKGGVTVALLAVAAAAVGTPAAVAQGAHGLESTARVASTFQPADVYDPDAAITPEFLAELGRLDRTTVVHVSAAAPVSEAFNWTDAGIGAASALALAVLGAATAIPLRRVRSSRLAGT